MTFEAARIRNVILREATGANGGPMSRYRTAVALSAGGTAEIYKAWELGYRTPEVAYALGLALGRLYQDQLKRARNIRLSSLREASIRSIEASYREPAVSYLRVGRAAQAVAVEYVAALIALYEERFDDALAEARAARERLPWLYESQILEADILTQRGDEERLAGDAETARASYRQAEPGYRQAIASAGSDPRGYIGLCDPRSP